MSTCAIYCPLVFCVAHSLYNTKKANVAEIFDLANIVSYTGMWRPIDEVSIPELEI
jgi:hypothetical protein